MWRFAMLCNENFPWNFSILLLERGRSSVSVPSNYWLTRVSLSEQYILTQKPISHQKIVEHISRIDQDFLIVRKLICVAMWMNEIAITKWNCYHMCLFGLFPAKYGRLTVTHQSTEELAFWTVRKFTIKNTKVSKKVDSYLSTFYYISWD